MYFLGWLWYAVIWSVERERPCGRAYRFAEIWYNGRMKDIMIIGLAATFACAGGLLWGQDLAVASPESQGVSSKAVLGWIEACENASATNMLKGHLHGFVILRHGRTIAEWE